VHTEIIDSWHVVDTADEGFEYVKNVKDTMESCDLSPNNFHCEGNIDWKIFRVMAELVEGFDFLSGIQNGVTVFGTKYVTDASYLKAGESLGKNLAINGYSVITGGKDGIAAAVNKGAFEHGGISLGIGMRVGGRDDNNAYLTKSITFNFPFTRKMIITSPSKAFVVFPGGFGTLHQLFEIGK
jgi:uncharacterized protein (TIGR00725 family)